MLVKIIPVIFWCWVKAYTLHGFGSTLFGPRSLRLILVFAPVIYYYSSMKLREGNVFNCVSLSFCVFTGSGFPVQAPGLIQPLNLLDLRTPISLPPRSWGKVMFLHMSVILFTWGSALRRSVPGSRGVPGPGGQYPSMQWGRAPEQCKLGDTGNKRVVCILLECILVSILFQNCSLCSTLHSIDASSTENAWFVPVLWKCTHDGVRSFCSGPDPYPCHDSCISHSFTLIV